MDPHGIPTVYKGRQYRSRLEARWAAFFDLLGWRYEYEPFDRRGWIPDFLLLGRDEVLVEVKPVAEFPWDYAERVIKNSGCEYDVLYLGSTNAVRAIESGLNCDPIGWFHRPSTERWYVTDAFLIDYSVLPSYYNTWAAMFGLCGRQGPSHDRISGQRCPRSGWRWDAGGAWRSWARAGNLTQWKGKQSLTW